MTPTLMTLFNQEESGWYVWAKSFSMKKLYFILTVILLIVLSKTSYAYDYDPLLMRAQATIFPKIILLDKNLERKIANNKIIINILYGDHDQHIAIKIKDLIQQQYKDSLGKQRLTINTTKFEHFDNSTSSTAYFLLKGTSVVHKKITAHAASQERMVFSYDYKTLKATP